MTRRSVPTPTSGRFADALRRQLHIVAAERADRTCFHLPNSSAVRKTIHPDQLDPSPGFYSDPRPKEHLSDGPRTTAFTAALIQMANKLSDRSSSNSGTDWGDVDRLRRLIEQIVTDSIPIKEPVPNTPQRTGPARTQRTPRRTQDSAPSAARQEIVRKRALGTADARKVVKQVLATVPDDAPVAPDAVLSLLQARLLDTFRDAHGGRDPRVEDIEYWEAQRKLVQALKAEVDADV